MTFHARKEMNDDGLTIYDVERGIVTGEILERQQDKVTAEWKYRIRGEIVEGDKIEIIAKLSPTNKLVIITVYAL
jgi:threonine aldolase